MDAGLLTDVLTEKVFVYGSLRKGQENHEILSRHPHMFEGKVQIKGDVRPTSMGYPCLMEGLGLVDGEIYAVSKNTIYALDEFEGCPSLYQRLPVVTTTFIPAWAYYGTGIQRYILTDQ